MHQVLPPCPGWAGLRSCCPCTAVAGITPMETHAQVHNGILVTARIPVLDEPVPGPERDEKVGCLQSACDMTPTLEARCDLGVPV